MKKETFVINKKTIEVANEILAWFKDPKTIGNGFIDKMQAKHGFKVCKHATLFIINEVMNEKCTPQDIKSFIYFRKNGEGCDYAIIWNETSTQAA